jgi:poly(hydroxyalkanoate) depolymerase family esterase
MQNPFSQTRRPFSQTLPLLPRNSPLLGQLSQATTELRTGKLLAATALIQRALHSGRHTIITIDGIAEPAGAHPLATTRPARRETPGAFSHSSTTGQSGSFTRHVFRNEAGSRPYMLYVPTGVPGPLPLIVMLHGCTQSAESFAAATNMNAIAEDQHCIVAYPEQLSAANASRCWNWFRTGDQSRGQGEPAIIAGIVRDIMRRYNVDPQRIYAAGLSAGGAAAAIMGETYPDLFAAIGVHSGLACGAARDMPSAMMAMKTGATAKRHASGKANVPTPIPTIVFHGSRDTTVNPANGNTVIARAAAGTAKHISKRQGQTPGGRSFTVTQTTDANGQVHTEHWLIDGMGHAWSGGTSGEAYTDPLGPDASREMMRFFLEQRRD